MKKRVKGVADEGTIEERIPVKDFVEVRKYLYVFGHLSKEEYEQSTSYIPTAA